jgi:hypothetical protein
MNISNTSTTEIVGYFKSKIETNFTQEYFVDKVEFLEPGQNATDFINSPKGLFFIYWAASSPLLLILCVFAPMCCGSSDSEKPSNVPKLFIVLGTLAYLLVPLFLDWQLGWKYIPYG